MENILLIDIENCGQALHNLEEKLKTYHQIYIVYATSNVNLSLDGLNLLIPFIQKQTFHLLKMPSTGKDAADFGLAFIAGQLSQAYQPENVCFEIISNDHAMDYVAELLEKSLFKVVVKKRENSLESHFPDDEQFQKLVYTLKKVKNRPTTEQAFINSIMSWTKVSHAKAYSLLKQLAEFNFLTETEKAMVTKPHVGDDKPHLVFLKTFCEYLDKQKNKPTTQPALLNVLKKVMHIEKENTVKDRYNLLIKHKIVVVNQQNNKITYNLDNISKYL